VVSSALPASPRACDKDLTPRGISKVMLKAGAAGKAKLVVTGKGAKLADTPLPGVRTNPFRLDPRPPASDHALRCTAPARLSRIASGERNR
jgi:hypothetical protein